MKTVCSLIVLGLMAAEAAIYVANIRKRSGVSPALSTWIIFLIGTCISMGSYIVSKKEDLLSGAMILADVAVVALVLASIVIWGDRTVRFRSFEKWYLAGCVTIICYGVASTDFFGSNIYAQALVATGYLPTFQKLVREKRNTEPYVPWILAIISASVGAVPAMLGANTLALIYCGRTLLLVGMVLLLMVWCDRRARRST